MSVVTTGQPAATAVSSRAPSTEGASSVGGLEECVSSQAQTMREVAQQLHLTTAEQADGVGRIRDSIGGVQTQMESIDDALQEQSKSTNQVVGFLEEVSSRSVANERAARLMGESTEELSEQARRLRAGMGRFPR